MKAEIDILIVIVAKIATALFAIAILAIAPGIAVIPIEKSAVPRIVMIGSGVAEVTIALEDITITKITVLKSTISRLAATLSEVLDMRRCMPAQCFSLTQPQCPSLFKRHI